MESEAGQPSPAVVVAFGGSSSELTKLPGGRESSWRAGSVVLKPEAALPWMAELLVEVRDTEWFRVARPVLSQAGTWEVDGWTATTWVEGTHHKDQWRERLEVADAFHRALPDVDESLAGGFTNQWIEGMRAAWGSGALPDDSNGNLTANVKDAFEPLAPLLAEPWLGSEPTLIHGDLGGNMLFAEGLPPAIIDMSPHFAPAPFAQAIIVADTVAWAGAPVEFARWFAAVKPQARQLLARAVVYRLCTSLLAGNRPDQVDSELAGYRPVLGAITGRSV